jgi:hypothetical protein
LDDWNLNQEEFSSFFQTALDQRPHMTKNILQEKKMKTIKFSFHYYHQCVKYYLEGNCFEGEWGKGPG